MIGSRKIVLCSALVLLSLGATSAWATTYPINAGGPIPTGAPIVTEGITDFTFTVANEGPVTDQVSLVLALQHQDLKDLTITLYSPLGQHLDLVLPALVNDAPGTFKDVLFADSGQPFVANVTGIYTGSYQAMDLSSTFAQFNGSDPNGTWTLEVNDGRPLSFGTLYAPDTVPAPWEPFVGTELLIQAHGGIGTVVPEPISASLGGLGLLALVGYTTRRRLAV